ncbi:MAG: rhodanese-like domain-containing protein [Gammaproteobacteria bacterium]|nr:rhodanese-like domain-containing protein [Gammaproteobacteria bacterium]
MHEKIDKVVSFYKFIKINDTDRIRFDIFNYLKELNILGTVLIANEGINANMCGSSKNIELVKSYIIGLLDLGNIHFNESMIKEKVFTKLKVKVKDEIIKAGFPATEEKVFKNKSLEPDDWDKLLGREPIIIDMRNRFEYLMGTFKNSKSLDLLNFSDLNKSLKEAKDLDKEKDIAIFCTGGIRCEKASIALDKLGFKNVFQLKGGIINYLDKNKDKGRWEGDCFVFDDRITY